MSMSFTNIHILNRSGLPPEEVHTALLEYYKAGGYVEAGKNEYSDKDVAFKVSADGRWISCFDEDWDSNPTKTNKALKTLSTQLETAGVSFMAVISGLVEMVLYDAPNSIKDRNAVGDWGLYHSKRPMPKGNPGKWLPLLEEGHTAEEIQAIWEAEYVFPEEAAYRMGDFLGIDRNAVMSDGVHLYTEVTKLHLRRSDRPSREISLTVTQGRPKMCFFKEESNQAGRYSFSIFNIGGVSRGLSCDIQAIGSHVDEIIDIHSVYFLAKVDPFNTFALLRQNPTEYENTKSSFEKRIDHLDSATGNRHGKRNFIAARFPIDIPEGVNVNYGDRETVEQLIECCKIEIVLEYHFLQENKHEIEFEISTGFGMDEPLIHTVVLQP